MADHIKKIARLLTDDPDVFNETAVGTGAIAFGPSGNISMLRPKRKKKARPNEGEDVENVKIKKYYADPVTGQPKVKGDEDDNSGEVLYADTKSEEPEEPIKENEEDTTGLNKLHKLLTAPIEGYETPSWYENGVPVDNQVRDQIRSNLREAFTNLQNIKHVLRSLKYGANCALLRDWDRYTKLILRATGSNIPAPPRGWWGQGWSPSETKKYYKEFFWEVAAKYLIEADQILDEHILKCDSAECTSKKHTLYMIKAFCDGEELSFNKIWGQHVANRSAAIKRINPNIEPANDGLDRKSATHDSSL